MSHDYPRGDPVQLTKVVGARLAVSTVSVQVAKRASGEAGRFAWPAILLCLVLLLYGTIVRDLVLQWYNDADYSHGFFVPFFSGYILWRQRERLLTIRNRPSNFGFVVMFAAISLLVAGSLGAELFTSRFSLLLLLAGMIVFLRGWDALRAVSFSLGFLLLMIPIPAIIYNEITFPLQLLASRLASSFLELVGVPVLRDGNVLVLSNYSLEVAEACSGIRSLMSLIALAIAYGYLAEPRRWARYLLVILMIPIAIIANAFRVGGAGIVAHRYGPAAAQGFLHEFSGWVVFLGALFMMFALHWVLQRVERGRREPAHA